MAEYLFVNPHIQGIDRAGGDGGIEFVDPTVKRHSYRPSAFCEASEATRGSMELIALQEEVFRIRTRANERERVEGMLDMLNQNQ